MRIVALIILLTSWIAEARAEDASQAFNVVVLSEGPLSIKRDEHTLVIRIPNSVRDAISSKWRSFRTIDQEDLPKLQEYWAKDADDARKGLPSADVEYSFAISEDVTGDGIPEVFVPLRHRNDECRWKIIAVHFVKGKYQLYEVDHDQAGQRGPCFEHKPWYGFEISGAGEVGLVSVVYAPSSCFVANFRWRERKGYVEEKQK